MVEFPVALLDFVDEKFTQMFALTTDFAASGVIVFKVENVAFQQGLCHFSVYYEQVDHGQHFKDYFLVLADVADCLEGQESFFFTRFTRFLDKLQANVFPFLTHVVTVENHVVSVLYIQFDICYILD